MRGINFAKVFPEILSSLVDGPSLQHEVLNETYYILCPEYRIHIVKFNMIYRIRVGHRRIREGPGRD